MLNNGNIFFNQNSIIEKKILFQKNVLEIFPGQRIRDGSGRNTPEVIGTWKQYSGRKMSGFSPVHLDHFLVLYRQELVGNHRKKSGNFPAGILLPCFDDFRCIPAGSSVFSISFLQVPSGSGHRNLRPGLMNFMMNSQKLNT